MQFVKLMGVYKYSTVAEAWTVSDKAPIGVHWVDTGKGERYRARLCAMEFRRKSEAAWFAGMPPLESLRALAGMLAAWPRSSRRDRQCMMCLGVERAHVHAAATRRIFVNLPPEDATRGEPGVCGELVLSMYGARGAAYNWEAAYSTYLGQLGFEKGAASPCHDFNAKTGVNILVHGDDCVAVGEEDALNKWRGQMEAACPCVSKLVGPKRHHEKELNGIGRWIRITPGGVGIEVDSRYATQALKAYGLDDAKDVPTPAVKEENVDQQARRGIPVKRLLGEQARSMTEKVPVEEHAARGEALTEEEARKFQSVAALLDFIAPDCPDLLFATKEVQRATARPGAEDRRRLKRILRYLRTARGECS